MEGIRLWMDVLSGHGAETFWEALTDYDPRSTTTIRRTVSYSMLRGMGGEISRHILCREEVGATGGFTHLRGLDFVSLFGTSQDLTA